MEFDINLVLVPVTLLFLVTYFVDKFFLKQHGLASSRGRLVQQAETHLEHVKKDFEAALLRFGHNETVDEFVQNEHTPEILKNASMAYHEARHKWVHAKVQAGDEPAKEHFLVRWSYEYLPILLIIIIVRSFLVEPFNIPSSSMVPSLYTGDFIIVNKSSYGLRLPITHTKILNTGSPKHGDVVVFRYPQNPKRYYIKRTIGLPGDTVTYDNGVLSVNGEKVQTKSVAYQMDGRLNAKIMPQVIGDQRLTDEERTMYGLEEEKHARYYVETFGKHTYKVRYLGDLNSAAMAPFLNQVSPEVRSSNGTKWQITVPQGQYFVMGDNRDRSEDSRFWGFVPEANLAGRATYIWMHKEPGLAMPSFGRVGAID